MSNTNFCYWQFFFIFNDLLNIPACLWYVETKSSAFLLFLQDWIKAAEIAVPALWKKQRWRLGGAPIVPGSTVREKALFLDVNYVKRGQWSMYSLRELKCWDWNICDHGASTHLCFQTGGLGSNNCSSEAEGISAQGSTECLGAQSSLHHFLWAQDSRQSEVRLVSLFHTEGINEQYEHFPHLNHFLGWFLRYEATFCFLRGTDTITSKPKYLKNSCVKYFNE